MVTQKFERQEELLTNLVKQRQEAVDDHRSGRKLLSDEVRRDIFRCSTLYIFNDCMSCACNLLIPLLPIPLLQQEFDRHQRHLKGLHRKLYATKNKDPQVSRLELHVLL